MHRIDNATAASQLPAVVPAGTPGYWTKGDTTVSPIVMPTALDQDFFNAVQEELCGIVEATGGQAIKGTFNQIWTALKSWFAPLKSPALTGTPTVPTANPGTNTTQAASTAFVANAVAPLATTAALNAAVTPLATTASVNSAIAPLPTYGSLALGAWQENYTTLTGQQTETITLTFQAPYKGKVLVTAAANFSGQVTGNALLTTSCNGATGSSDNVANPTSIANQSCFEVLRGAVSVASFIGLASTGQSAVGHTLSYLYVPE